MKKAFLAAVLLLVILALAGAFFWIRADDPQYLLKETISLGRYGKYDALIRQTARRQGVPPELIKAVIWRESRFHPDKIGSQGERGLMQITESAAADWAKSEKVETFAPTDLFDPKVNLEAGAWYLGRALNHWEKRDNPTPFALAEYNAGRTRVKRWMQDSGHSETASAEDLRASMDFPATKSYIASIQARYDYYKTRGDFR